LILSLALCALPSLAHVPHHVIQGLAVPPDLSASESWYALHVPYGVPVLLQSPGGDYRQWQDIGGAPTADDLVATALLDDGSLVVISEERIWWSTDGESWQQEATPEMALQVVGGEALWLGTVGGVWTGLPGQGWEVSLAEVAVTVLRDGPGGLLAIEDTGASAFILAQEDWQELPAPGAALMSGVAAEDAVYVGDADGLVWRWSDEAWQACGVLPENTSGEESYPHVTQLAASEDWLLAQAAWGGPFASDDGCASWQDRRSPLTAQFSQTTIEEAFTGLYAAGDRWVVAGWDCIGMSEDAGQSWVQAFIMPADLTRGLASSPNFEQDDQLYIGANTAGVYRTADGLRFESLAGHLTHANIQKVGFYPDASSTDEIFAISNHDLWRSTDGGFDWLEGGSPHAYVHNFVLFDDPGRIWVIGRASVDGGSELVESVDGGESWQELPALDEALDGASPHSATRAPDGGICLSASNPTSIVCSDPAIESWERIFESESVEPAAILSWPSSAPQRLIFADDQGIHLSDDDGDSWRSADPLQLDSVYRLGQADDGTLVMATRGAELLRSDDGGDSWEETGVRLPSQVYVLVFHPDFAKNDVLWAGTHDGICQVSELHSAAASWEAWARYQLVDNDSTYIRYEGQGNMLSMVGAIMSQVQPLAEGTVAQLGLRGNQIRILGLSDGKSQVRVEVDGEEVATLGEQVQEIPGQLALISDLGEGYHHVVLTAISGEGVLLDALESWYGEGGGSVIPDTGEEEEEEEEQEQDTAAAQPPPGSRCPGCASPTLAGGLAWLVASLGLFGLRRRRRHRA